MHVLSFVGAASVLLVAGVIAQDNGDFEIWGNATVTGPFKGSQDAPDATLSASFQAWDLREDWTWRVNITSISKPGARQPPSPRGDDPPVLLDPHIVRTTWDFSWPNGGNLTDNVGNASKICIAIINRANWPVNVSSLYQEAPDGKYETNCAPIIGSECFNAYIASSMYNSETDSCEAPNSVHNLPECRYSLGFGSDTSISTTAVNLLRISSLASGDGFFTEYLEAHNGTDGERYMQHAKDHIQMAITEIVYHDGPYLTTGAQMHCL